MKVDKNDEEHVPANSISSSNIQQIFGSNLSVNDKNVDEYESV